MKNIFIIFVFFLFFFFSFNQISHFINNNINNININNNNINDITNQKSNNYINNDILKNILKTALIQEATSKHTATVIFIHGLGDTGNGWIEVMKMIQKNGNSHIKFICPTAPIQEVTLNNGRKMNSWYDIKKIGINEDDGKENGRGNINKKDFDQSKELIEILIKNEIYNHGIPSERIIIGGFSQGCALSLYTFYSQKSIKLAGCLALSGYLPFHSIFSNIIKDSINLNQPLLMFHGESDQVIKFSWAHLSFQILKNRNANAEFISFKNMGHSSSKEEINYIIKFINQYLPL